MASNCSNNISNILFSPPITAALATRCPLVNNSNRICGNGLLLRDWLPPPGTIDQQAIAFRAFVYSLGLIYLLLGISIIMDRIVSAMEVIASQKRTKSITLKNGETKFVKVLFWHPVIISLTVFAVGDASPEICLSFVELFKHRFHLSEMAPSLIVGSAAYHLFAITGICLLSGRETFPKPILDRWVFFTQTICAILAYFWVYVILGIISPGIIEPWEGALTIFYFPLLVAMLWAVSRRFPQRLVAYVFSFFRATSMAPCEYSSLISPKSSMDDSPFAGDTLVEEAKRRKLGKLLLQLKACNPDKTELELEELAQLKMIEDAPKSSAFYRLQATNAFSGGANAISKERIKEKLEEEQMRNNSIQRVGFAPAYYTCAEHCGSMKVTIQRTGMDLSDTKLTVNYHTEEAKARAYINFAPTFGKVTFQPGEQSADIVVKILDDGIYGVKAKTFRVKLSYPELLTLDNKPKSDFNPLIEMTSPIATISIVDGDHCGVFGFGTSEHAIPDNIGVARIKVIREIGSKCDIALPYRINPGTAKPAQDYVAEPKATLHFVEGQLDEFIEIEIIDKNRVGEVYTFFVELGEPKRERNVSTTVGCPSLGENAILQIGICENEEMKEAVDRLAKMPDLADYVVSTTWLDQFCDVVMIHYGHGPTKPSVLAMIKIWIIYIISLPWKLLVALVPPSRMLNGWIAYFCLLALMALATALIDDCATHLGCTIGLTDSANAITIIAFGMGLPDALASRHAAIHEKTADAAIGHITGANAVSVFLGIGLPWTVAALYHISDGKQLKVKYDNFGFSVMLYCSFATASVLVLLLRRLPPIRGELGGPAWSKILSATFFIALWLLFVTLSVLNSYCVINPIML